MPLTIPPNDKNSELVILNELTACTAHANRMFDKLQASDFYDQGIRESFETMLKARKAGRYEECATDLLSKGCIETPAKFIKLWRAVDMVVANAARRRILEAIGNLHQKLDDKTTTIQEVNRDVEEILVSALDARTAELPADFNEYIDKTIESFNKPMAAIKTGMPDLDSKITITQDSFLLIAARPAVGKTALANSIMINTMYAGKVPGFASMEMSGEQIVRRMIAIMSGTAFQQINNAKRGTENYESVQSAIRTLRQWAEKHKKWLWPGGRLTVDKIKHWLQYTQPDYAVIDYVQLMKSSRGRQTGREELEETINSIREVSLGMKIPIIGLAQLNRDQAGDVPRLSHLKGSGNFEQAASEVILLDRPTAEPNAKGPERNYVDRYGNKINMTEAENGTCNVAAIIAKNRNGPTGYSMLKFFGPTYRFYQDELIQAQREDYL